VSEWLLLCLCIRIESEMASGKGKLSHPCNMTNQYFRGFLGINNYLSSVLR
jgi:hypothetical protein